MCLAINHWFCCWKLKNGTTGVKKKSKMIQRPTHLCDEIQVKRTLRKICSCMTDILIENRIPGRSVYYLPPLIFRFWKIWFHIFGSIFSFSDFFFFFIIIFPSILILFIFRIFSATIVGRIWIFSDFWNFFTNKKWWNNFYAGYGASIVGRES